MRIARAVVVACSMLAICLAGGAFALAQETGQTEADDETTQSGDEPSTTETDESKQPTEEEEEKETEEPQVSGYVEGVTVTATRVETDLMKTPIAVTVLDQETMDREGVESVRDIAQMVPNTVSYTHLRAHET